MTINLRPEISKALQLIAVENQRIAQKYPTDHDDEHVDGELAQAGAVYAQLSTEGMAIRRGVRPNESWKKPDVLQRWPFDEPPKIADEDDNEARIADLVKAGNLIVSEIARRLRAS